jgi:hypothetical protein
MTGYDGERIPIAPIPDSHKNRDGKFWKGDRAQFSAVSLLKNPITISFLKIFSVF